MGDSDTEFRAVLVEITDYISPDGLNKLKFIFHNKIKRRDYSGTTINGIINLFEQLLDRGIINRQNLSNLISALDHSECGDAAQRLRDYQSKITKDDETLLEKISVDNELDKRVTHDIDDRSSNLQQDFLFDDNKSRTSRLTLYEKINAKMTTIKYLILLIIFLTYTIILIMITFHLVSKRSPIDDKSIHSRAKFCEPNPSERYFIRSRYNEKFIGVFNDTNYQGEQLHQWNNNRNQSCYQQWYFIPLPNQRENKIYIIQSVYNGKVIDVSRNSSDDNRIQQSDMVMNNINQQFQLIYVQNEDLCLIRSVATNKVLNAAINKEFITQTDLQIKDKESISEEYKTLWQLIPFNTDKPINCPYLSAINDLTTIKFGNVFGINGDHSTDDSNNFGLTKWHYISSISIISSDQINIIEFIYSSTNPLNTKSDVIRRSVGIYNNNNNSNYRSETFNVTEKNPHERINRVNIFITDYSKVSDRYIVGIQFHTTFNRMSPFYGIQQGQSYVEEYPGLVLAYVRGEAHIHIERLQFIWYKMY